MADNKVTVEFEVTGNAAKKIDEIAESTKGLESSFKKGFEGATNAFNVFKGSLAAEVVVRGFEKATDAAKELFNVILTDGVKSAIAEENAIATLNGTLAANGNYSKQASKDLRAFAEELEKTTKFGNETIIAAAGLIEGLSKLDSQGLKIATKGAADLAALFNTDLNTAASAIGKAFEGSTRGLKQFGIEITATNDKALLQQQILTALAQRQGAAALQTNTYSGATAQLSNAFDNFIKQVGLAIIQNPQLIAAIKNASIFFGELENKLKENSSSMSEFISNGINAIIGAIPTAIGILEGFAKAILYVKESFQFVAAGAYGVVIAMSELQLSVARVVSSSENIKNIEDRITNLRGAQGLLFESIDKTNKAIDNVSTVSAGAISAVNQFATATAEAVSASDATSAALDKQSASVVQLTDAQEKNIEAGLALDAQLSTVQAGIDAQTALITAQYEAGLLSDQEYYTQKQALLDQSISDQSVKITAAYSQGLLSEQKYQQDQAVLQKKADTARLQQQKIQDDKMIQQRDSFLSLASTLQRSKSQELVAIGKAAAITQIAIDTPKAVSGAFAFGSSLAGPALGFTLAAIAATAEAALAAQVAGVGLANGIDSVPGSGNRDNFPAVLMPGERVVPTATNRDLTSFLSGSGTVAQTLQSIDNKLSQLQNSTIVNIGSKNIVNELRDAMAGGRVINV